MPLASTEQAAEFTRASPTGPVVDTSRLVRARLQTRPHRVVPGEVLELAMPAILRVVTADEAGQVDDKAPFVCRVSPTGTIVLPVVGPIPAAGRSLAEIEASIANAYYPAYAKVYPSVLAKVIEYRTHRVSISGAIKNPGIYDLKADQMSLVCLIMEAGGIIDEGASFIRITHGLSDDGTPDPSPRTPPPATQSPSAGADRTVVLPVKGLNTPFMDVALREGDSVAVERMAMPVFTVIGLVNKPGNFPYPPGTEYNLMQAIGFAGGLDDTKDPRYAMVYRLKPDGGITYMPIEVSDPKKKGGVSTAMGVLIKPGDIIALEHTPRTRTNAFLERVFHFSVGAYIPVLK